MPITNKHVKDSLLEGKKVRANNWEISINNNDEVVIFPPTGDGFSTTLAHLDKAVDDYCKKANVRKPGSSKKLAEEKVGPDSETQNLLKSPSIKKSPPAENTPDTDMNVGSEDDQPYTPKPTDKSPEVYPAPGGGGMPSTDLGSDSEGDMKWGRSVKIKDTFSDDSAPMDFYRELKATKPSAELLKDITNERKWVANNRYADVPKKWEPTVKKMKDKPEIDNPYALANWMESEGYTPGREDKKSKSKRAQSGMDVIIYDSPPENKWLGSVIVETESEAEDYMSEYGGGFGRGIVVSGEVGGNCIVKTEDGYYGEFSEGSLVGQYKEDLADFVPDEDFYSDISTEDILRAINKKYPGPSRGERFKKSNTKKAGPKLREKWDDKGSYHRDIEAESPEELHALTRALGGEEIDWSPFKKNEEDLNEVMAEDSMDEVTACAKDSESDVEAVDDKAKDYYDKYFEQADSNYGKQLTKGDVTDRKRIQRDKKKSQMAPAPAPKQQAPAPQADPMAQQAPAAPPAGGAPAAPGGAPKPGAPGAGGMKPGTGDAGLQALGWTPEDIQLLDEQDKQKILQVQLNKPGTKQPKAPAAPGVPEKGPAPAAPGASTAPAVPGQGAAPAPQKPAPAPVASKLAKEIMKKLQFKRAQMLLTAQEMVNTEEAAPVPPAPAPAAPAAPGQGSMPEFQGPAGEAAEGATVEQKAFQILSEVQQMSVPAATPESVPSTKAQELSKRLLTELGMPSEEAKTLFGVSKSNQGLISLFK